MKEKLTPTFCRSAKPGWSKELNKPIDRRYADGGKLYLMVKPDSRKDLDPEAKPMYPKSWVFRFQDPVTRFRHDMGLGVYGPHDVKLADARVLAGDARKLLSEFKNPIDERKRLLREAQAAQAKLLTFQQCADTYIKTNKAQWKSLKHAAQWSSTLTTYAAPIMGMLVRDIGQVEVLSCIEPHWTSKTETMTRVRQRIEAVLAWAKVMGYRTGDNPAQWKNHLDKVLPKPTALKKVVHRAALPYSEAGGFMVKLRAKNSMAARALELQILTATRPGEVVGATWSEFQLENASITVVGKDEQVKVIKVAGLWTIPGERMKAGVEHVIPLPQQAVSLLKALPRIDGSEFVFPGLRPSKPMSTAAGMKLLKQIRPDITAHGMRSSFRDWAGESTAYPREVIEMALAHRLKDKAEAAYFRGNLIDKRRKLMADWARYCDTVQGEQANNVTPIGKQL